MRNSGILPEGTIPVYKIVPVHNIIYIEPSPPFFYRLKNIKNQCRVVKYRIILGAIGLNLRELVKCFNFTQFL